MASAAPSRGAVLSRPLRLALVVVGLVLAAYGVASLTGGWLGAPPWWVRTVAIYEVDGRGYVPLDEPAWRREDNAWWSGGVIAGGLGLAGFCAWRRRRHPEVGG